MRPPQEVHHEGLQKAEGEKSAGGKTYGDLIKAGKLPGGGIALCAV